MSYFLDNGYNLSLGRQIGRGGEGSVFAVNNMPNHVAKIYHNKLSPQHEQKLRSMVSLVTPQLSNNATWPEGLIYKKGSQSLQGILIPYVKGHELHEVYGPSSRKHVLPQATWDFLVYVARNLVYAFDTLHSHGIIVGDVNEKNFIISDDARVRLIDCDSYQIPSTNSSYHLCKVGVVLYTPPELQGRNLSAVIRTKNHDLFGLAVLIFQLLFMGRHPFAGISKDAKLNSLDNGESIRNFLYAFGRNAPTLGVFPPPHSLTLSLIPQTFADLFEIAFSKNSALNNSRPTEQYWISELDKLFRIIVTCRHEKNHKYPNHLAACPWCSFTSRYGVHFFVCITFPQFVDLSTGDAAAFKNAIDQIKHLALIRKPEQDYGVISIIGREIPSHMKLPSKSFYFGILIIIACLITTFSTGLWPALLGIFWGWSLISKGKHSPEFIQERNNRKYRLDEVRRQFKTFSDSMDDLVRSYNNTFTTTHQQLIKNYERYTNLESERKKELQIIESKRHDIQLEAFLEKFMLSNSSLRDIGPNRKATLLSYGIETAADIKRQDILQISGFGNHLCGILLSWEEACKKKFIFEPSKPIPQQFIDALNKKVVELKTQLKEDMRRDINKLNGLNSQTMNRYKEIDSKLPFLFKELKQSEADYSIVS